MKTVYADVVMLVNFCADYVILFLSSRFLHIKTTFVRLLCASLFGAVYGLLAVVSEWSSYLLLPAMLSMCYIAFGKRSIQTYVKTGVIVFVFSLMLSGISGLIGSSVMCKENMLFGIALIIASSFCLYLLSTLVHRVLHTQIYTQAVNVRIHISGQMLDTVLMADSGNLLVEPVSQKRVIVLDRRYRRFFSDNDTCEQLLSFKTVSGYGIVELYNAQQIVVNNKKTEALIGFCISGMHSFDGYDGIIPGVLIQNI